MIRKIIRIDREKCNGCGLCAEACHEGAIGIADGKAMLLREDFCDGLGNCLPVCPQGAISFEEREAPGYNEAAVKRAAEEKTEESEESGSPGLGQWPCQIRLVPVNAAFFDGADLLIAADCTAYAYANIHKEFMRGRITLIGCPKLDNVNYSEKLTGIISENDIRSICVLRMEVPCCGGLEVAVKTALKASGKKIPGQVITVMIDGKIEPEYETFGEEQ